MASKAVEDLPLPMLYGVHLSRFLHDTTHSQLLGTSKVLNGSVLTYLCEAGEFGMFPAGIYDAALSSLLPMAFANFKDYLRTNHLQCTQPRFTAARLNRRHRGQFPCLASKAVNGKRISYWLASKCAERCNRLGEDATELDILVMTTTWCYCAMLQQFENCPMVLTEAQAAKLHRFGMTHLLSYSALRSMSSQTHGRVVNRSSWPVLPKHHHLQHALDDALETLINPGSYHLLGAESWVGIVGRMSRCHVNQRSTFGRFMFSDKPISIYTETLWNPNPLAINPLYGTSCEQDVPPKDGHPQNDPKISHNDEVKASWSQEATQGIAKELGAAAQKAAIEGQPRRVLMAII